MLTWPFRYFWFILAGVMLLNVAVWRGRLPRLISQGRITEREADRFTVGAALAFTVPCVMLGLIALSARWPMPQCGGVLSFRDAPSTATTVIILASWGALLAWLWFGRGADMLARVGPVLTNRPQYDRSYSPVAVRVAITALVLGAGLGGALISRRMPRLPACEVLRVPG